jgi:hypothetical protein
MKKDKEKKRIHVNKRAAAGAIIIAAAIAAASACVRVRPSSGTGASAYETTASETAPSAESLEGKGPSLHLSNRSSYVSSSKSVSVDSFNDANTDAQDVYENSADAIEGITSANASVDSTTKNVSLFRTENMGNTADTSQETATETVSAKDLSNETTSASDNSADTSDSSSHKLIRMVSLAVETDDLDGFTSELENETKILGGYVEQSSSDENTANYTLRVPKPKVDDLLSFTDDKGHVTSKNESVNDVTLQYRDTEARKKALEEEYDRIMALLEKADNLDTILSLEQRLSDIRYDLDNYSSNLRVVDNQVEYSTVYVTVYRKSVYTPAKEDTMWDKIKSNFTSNLIRVGDAFTSFIVWFLGSLPVIAVWAVIIVIIVKLCRFIVKRHDEKLDKRIAAEEAAKRKREELIEKRMRAHERDASVTEDDSEDISEYLPEDDFVETSADEDEQAPAPDADKGEKYVVNEDSFQADNDETLNDGPSDTEPTGPSDNGVDENLYDDSSES